MNEKTDRELLELAAKAAGYNHLTEWSESISDYDSHHCGEPALHEKGIAGQCRSWNALIDDGDAMALQRALYLSIYASYHCCQIVVSRNGYGVGMPAIEVVVNGDLPGATMTAELYRRAIVMAAAQIGEAIP